jgi:predicted TIM-barrel fold metal-dependent hydrolase
MNIIDTHQHLWDLNLFQYSWLTSLPTLNRSYRMADYLHAAASANIVKSIHMEADVDQAFMLDETMHVLGLIEQPENPLTAIVACARPENKDFYDYLNKIARNPKVKGIRRVLHTQPDHIGQDEGFLAHVGSLADYNLSFDVCVLARQLPIAINLVSRCPRVTFILDHCGVPQVKDRIMDPWRDHIAELARFSNLYCKVSGLVAYADPQKWTAEDLRPYVEHVIACFGWDRVVFGSDWPVCTVSASLQQWVDALTLITQGAGEANQKRLFHDNAIRVYRLT